MKVFPITIKIYAEDEQEAEQTRQALGGFVDQLGQMGIPVTGTKIADGLSRWQKNTFVKSQIINHFKE
jgi:hypothetical protein